MNMNAESVKLISGTKVSAIDQVPHPKAIAPLLQILANYQEHLDRLTAKTVDMEKKMDQLQQSYAQQQMAWKARRLNVGWMESGEIDALFHDSMKQKDAIRSDLDDIKNLLLSATSAKSRIKSPHIVSFVADHIVADWILEEHIASHNPFWSRVIAFGRIT
jgi:hypothetical protein